MLHYNCLHRAFHGIIFYRTISMNCMVPHERVDVCLFKYEVIAFEVAALFLLHRHVQVTNLLLL